MEQKLLCFNNLKFYSEYKSCCLHNCIMQILTFYGVEHAHLLMNTCYKFTAEVDDLHTLHIMREPANILIGNYNKHVISSKPSELSYREENLAKIKEGIPIAVLVDVFYLPYDKHFQKSNSIHTIIFIGEDQNFDPYIIDYGERVQYQGKISKNDYHAARSSVNPKGDNLYSGHPIEFKETYINRGDWLKNIEYEELIFENLENVLSYYSDQDVGLVSVKKIIYYLKNIEYEKEEGNENIFYEELYYQLYSVNRKRKMFKLTLVEIYNKYKIATINGDLFIMDDIIKEWNYILSLLLKMKFVQKQQPTLHKIIQHMEKVFILEKAFFENVSSLFNFFK